MSFKIPEMESGARQPKVKVGAAVWVTWGSLLKFLTAYEATFKALRRRACVGACRGGQE